MAEIVLRGVEKRFGEVRVIRSLDLRIADGEFCVFVGPSGCGKSTLLRLVAGLEDLSAGTIAIGGRDVSRLPPAARGVAMVFQSYALYPHMSVADNITFGLRTARADKRDVARRLERAARMLQLEALLDRKPAQLSGGQRQRVAIGRAIVRNPQVFLFDEPLSNLDAALRTQMRIEIAGLHRELGTTMIYVTHDQVEAMTMADRIVVLNSGQVEQVGAPLELYGWPSNMFVAGFIGSPRMNFIETSIESVDGEAARVMLPNGAQLSLPVHGAHPQSGAPAVLGFRPEHIVLGRGRDVTIAGTVKLAESLGAETILHVDTACGLIVARIAGLVRVKDGETVELCARAAAAHLFAPGGAALLQAHSGECAVSMASQVFGQGL